LSDCHSWSHGTGYMHLQLPWQTCEKKSFFHHFSCFLFIE
jgi:hypothetical protein